MELAEAREILLEHARHPRNHLGQGQAPRLGGSCVRGDSYNPLCGDKVQVFLSVIGDRIDSCSISVQGCAMCTASSSVMSLEVKNLTGGEAERLRVLFTEALLGNAGQPWPETLEAFAPFSHLCVNRARIPCALIPWYALKEALGQLDGGSKDG